MDRVPVQQGFVSVVSVSTPPFLSSLSLFMYGTCAPWADPEPLRRLCRPEMAEERCRSSSYGRSWALCPVVWSGEQILVARSCFLGFSSDASFFSGWRSLCWRGPLFPSNKAVVDGLLLLRSRDSVFPLLGSRGGEEERWSGVVCGWCRLSWPGMASRGRCRTVCLFCIDWRWFVSFFALDTSMLLPYLR
jgi:hypothetical protein